MVNYSFSIFGVLPYFILLIVLFLILHSNKKGKEKCWYCFIALFIFSAIRYGIGYDYYNYKDLALHNVPDYSLEGTELFSRVIVDIAYITHYQLFFVLGSLITLYPLYLSCKKMSINPAYSMLIFFLHPLMYLNGLCIVRNAMAFSCVLYAIVLLRENRFFYSLFFVLSAFLFHRSGVFGILIYPIYYFKAGRNIYLLMYIISFGVSLLVANVLTGYTGSIQILIKAGGYASQENTEGGGTMTYIVNALCIFNIVFWNKISELMKGNDFWLKYYVFGACIWNVFLSINPTMASRLSLFFIQSLIFIVPFYKYLLGKRYTGMAGKLTTSFFVLLFFSYFYINISSYIKDSSSRMSNIPYQTIFYKEDYSNYLNY